MELIRFFIIFVVFAATIRFNYCKDGFTFKNPIRFPWAGGEFVPYMGIFLALALPLDLPDYNVFVSFNLEANYVLPQNQSEFSYPPIISKRSIDRKYFYKSLEKKFVSHGFKGKSCLLRTICEASEYDLGHNGILGDLLHILLTPSSSNDTDMSEHYTKAEEYSKKRGHCKKYAKNCPISLLSLVSHAN